MHFFLYWSLVSTGNNSIVRIGLCIEYYGEKHLLLQYSFMFRHRHLVNLHLVLFTVCPFSLSRQERATSFGLLVKIDYDTVFRFCFQNTLRKLVFFRRKSFFEKTLFLSNAFLPVLTIDQYRKKFHWTVLLLSCSLCGFACAQATCFQDRGTGTC